ncbi:MAG: alpha/beta hydrolase [Pseudomonadota bacterium]
MKVEVSGHEVHVGTGSRPLDPTQPAVLFVHGAGMDHTVWVMQARYFARKGYAVLAPDLPGHGRSAGEPLKSIEAMADWLAELLRVLAVPAATVVGHSMGSLVACAFPARHPEQTTAIVLFGASLPMPVTHLLLDAAEDNDHAAFTMANSWSHSTAGSLGGNPVPGMFVLRGGERLLERLAPGVYFADLSACNAFDPAELGPVTVPATVVVGTEDRMTPQKAGLKVAASLGSETQVRTLAGSGHSMMSECPNEVLDILIDAVPVPRP